MIFDRQKITWLKFDVLDFRDFLPSGLEGNDLKVGPVFYVHPVLLKSARSDSNRRSPTRSRFIVCATQ